MLCGRLIDRMGRRNMLLFGLFIGLLSNVLGAIAPNMLVLVVSRALYGLGYGFINAAVMIMINELFGKKERIWLPDYTHRLRCGQRRSSAPGRMAG